jgi:hypothetical protein
VRRRKATGKEDDPRSAAPDQSWIRNLGPILGHRKKAMIFATLMAIVERGLFGLLPLVQRTVIDESILAHRSPMV